MDQRLIAVIVISSSAHALLALLISATISPESNALHVPPNPIQVRLVSAEHVHSGRELSETPELVDTPEIDLASQASGEADRPVVAVGLGSVLPNAIGESHVSALAAPLPHVEINDPNTSTAAEVEVKVVLQEELDVQPVPIDPVIPVYPSEELAASAGGLIKLQLLIDEVGRVTSVEVIESALPATFGVSAARAFEAVRFRPGLRNGSPVRCRVNTSIQFAPTALAQLTIAQPDAQVGLRE